MAGENWATTQQKLKVWAKTSKPTAWELRKVLSASSFYTIILQSALKLAKQKYKNIPSHVNIKDFWGFYLEKIQEKDAITLLLDTWNVEIWRHINVTAKYEMKDIMKTIIERANFEYDFNYNKFDVNFEVTSLITPTKKKKRVSKSKAKKEQITPIPEMPIVKENDNSNNNLS